MVSDKEKAWYDMSVSQFYAIALVIMGDIPVALWEFLKIVTF